MKWLMMVLAAVAILVVVLLAVGWLLPETHRASRQATVPVSADAVWAVITNVDAFPSWRSDVKSVQRLPDRDGRPAWVEDTSNGKIPLAVERSEAPRLLVVRIADPNLPFGGTWTYEITPTANGSTLTITEDGAVYNPLFRVMARFVFGYEATLATYLQSLEAALKRAS
jgi:uncharacterized protein YndB with AHSA1/START domain